MISLLCLILGLTLVGLGCGLRARHMQKQESYNFMSWVVFDTISVLCLGLDTILIGLLAFVALTSSLPF